MCSYYDKHFRFCSPHNWGVNLGGPSQPFDEHKNLHFDHEKDIHMNSNNYKESAYNFDFEIASYLCVNCTLHVLGEAG